MATYAELHALRGATSINPLREKIAVALVIKANLLAKSATPTAAQKSWALAALGNPGSFVETVLNYILGEYNTVGTVAIVNATDVQIQAAVNAAVDTLLGV